MKTSINVITPFYFLDITNIFPFLKHVLCKCS